MDLKKSLEKLGGVDPVIGDELIPMSEAEVGNIERKLGAPLPGDYRELLTTLGGIQFREMVEFTPIDPLPPSISTDGKGLINLFYGAPAHEPHALSSVLNSHASRMPEGFVPIGDDGGGDKICLMTVGEKRGHVFYWDHHHEWDEEDYIDRGRPIPDDLKWQNVTHIARSFEDLLARLSVAAAP